LDRQEIVSEAALRGRGQHEENHESAVQGQQAEVLLILQQMELRSRQVDPHQHGKNETDKHRSQRQEVVLNANNFMIEAEDVFADEASRRSMSMRRVLD